jgi:hypothetical protein
MDGLLILILIAVCVIIAYVLGHGDGARKGRTRALHEAAQTADALIPERPEVGYAIRRSILTRKER